MFGLGNKFRRFDKLTVDVHSGKGSGWRVRIERCSDVVKAKKSVEESPSSGRRGKRK